MINLKIPKGLIDSTNRRLWRKIIWKYKVDLDGWEHCPYSSFVIEENRFKRTIAKLRYDSLSLKTSYFSHELLHINFHRTGFRIDKIIDSLIWDSDCLKFVCERKFKDVLGNVIQHEKMLPIYLEMGYPKEEFIGDYQRRKHDLNDLKNSFQNDDFIDQLTLKFFIAAFFEIKGCINLEFDYSKELEFLNSIKPKLFDTLETFWNGWISLGQKPNNKIEYDLASDLIMGLEREFGKCSINT